MKNLKLKILLLMVINLHALNLPHYFHAKFTQKIYSDKKTLTYKGEIYTDSKQVFWKYTYPNTKEIWINDKVYVYEPDLLQVTISKKPKLNLFEAIKKAKKTEKGYIAKIDNKTIHFIYDKTLKKAWYTDDIGNKVVINFKDVSTKKINPEIFTPKFPDDVDIIYQR